MLWDVVCAEVTAICHKIDNDTAALVMEENVILAASCYDNGISSIIIMIVVSVLALG